jgi:hypothetical protein
MPQSSLTGIWKLNVPASNLPFAPPRSVVVDIVVEGDDISITENSVNAEGYAETVTIRARFDSQVYPVKGSVLADGFAYRASPGAHLAGQRHESGGAHLHRDNYLGR